MFPAGCEVALHHHAACTDRSQILGSACDRSGKENVVNQREPVLRQIFAAALAAADPKTCLAPAMADLLANPPSGRLLVVGAGKASGAMAAAFEAAWLAAHPDRPIDGLVITRYDHKVATQMIEVVEAAHPVPDQAGLAAAERMLALANGLRAGDLMVALISGGGSALLSLPAAGVGFADKQRLTDALLHSGANIHEMNCVRKHLSAIKGGRLAAAAFPARSLAYVISDVPGDDLATIASGPTVADPTTLAMAAEILADYKLTVPASIAEQLRTGAETPKPGDKALSGSQAVMVATPQMALTAAAAAARANGYTPMILGDAIEGEAREVGQVMAAIAAQVARHQQPLAAPAILLSGGETTVTVRGSGCGGRNVEFLLALGLALDQRAGDCRDRIAAIACDTDGIDGAATVAGAYLPADTARRAKDAGVDLSSALAGNDGHGFFAALQTAVITGPTLTNVNDFRAILIDRQAN